MLDDLERSTQFKRDYKLMIKQNRDISLLDGLITDLYKEKPLPPNYRDHSLAGSYNGFRECHIAGMSDWLLIYKIKDRVLTLVRTGTHAELFE
ncbi:MAG: type II toxin-antitoxin system YafQ family toxin [Oscillospiraceae bacterium]|jgi:mRNA interferase YafQ|nr:type II toxin-antitoxin system YafQ family toxin [Oscillospiraceae bacterium]